MSSSPVIRCGTAVRTHADVRTRAARLATVLATMGVEHGDRYAIVLRNDIAFVEATLAGAAIGAVPVPVNWHWTGDDLEYLLADSGSKVVLVHTDLLPAVEAVLPAGAAVIEVAVPDDVAAAHGFTRPELTGRHPDMDTLIGAHAPVTAPVTDPPLGVIYTSGTTGRPKGILRQPVPAEHARRLAELVVEGFAFGSATSTLIPAPLYHTAPNTHAVFALALGLDLDIPPRFDAEGLLALIQERRIEHLQMVPTMFVRWLKLPEDVRARYDLSSLKSIVHAAAPCPQEVKRAIIDWLGPIVHEYYGGSETGAAVNCTSEQWLEHPGTVGRPFADVEVKILDDDGTELPPGQAGEIYIKPFSVWPDFTYLGNDAKRREIERDGFLSVGDIGYLDTDGYLYLSDRRNDMVISGGVNIYPAEIEACIITVPGVRDVAVFGIPDPDFGEALAAHIELEPDARVGAEDIRTHVTGHLAKYKVPEVVAFDDTLPREDTGKLFKRKLN
ncbi:AMP-binding protein [Rhodococcus opacus]|uniref:Putative fatty-acid--CoA ligase n=1 Tax=Rhodococcus opacus (strain B4) TaxID=632772 RepID=C1B2I7_RHOOB|nr:AMP-binding protein [Rhodococcus opacus]BAH50611.1 putative fatty-acid--CoA ligase [Rhodococcus opacus B4]